MSNKDRDKAWQNSIFATNKFDKDLRRTNTVRDIFNEGFDMGSRLPHATKESALADLREQVKELREMLIIREKWIETFALATNTETAEDTLDETLTKWAKDVDLTPDKWGALLPVLNKLIGHDTTPTNAETEEETK